MTVTPLPSLYSKALSDGCRYAIFYSLCGLGQVDLYLPPPQREWANECKIDSCSETNVQQ